jgi:hypothetical protein
VGRVTNPPLGVPPPLRWGDCQNGRRRARSAKMAGAANLVPNFSIKFFSWMADNICSRKERAMYNLVMILGFLGYGVGFEGYDSGKVYFGVYTPDREYGYVMTNREVYLDTIFSRLVK